MNSSLAIALLLLGSQTPIVQNTDDALRTELHENYKRWFAALYRGDDAAIDALEVSDFVLVGTDGGIMEKHRPRASDPLPHPEGTPERTWTDGVVRRFGETAILTGQITTETPQWTASMATTAVFVRRADKWLIASIQWTPIPKPKGNE